MMYLQNHFVSDDLGFGITLPPNLKAYWTKMRDNKFTVVPPEILATLQQYSRAYTRSTHNLYTVDGQPVIS